MSTRDRRWVGAHRLRFLTDVDEVLCDFKGPSSEAMKRLGYTLPEDFDGWNIFSPLSESQLEALFQELKSPGWCRGLLACPGAKEAIAEIQTFADVYAVTSQFDSQTWVYERTEWLKEHFGLDSKKIVFTRAKYTVAGDAFLDDHPENVSKWVDHHPDGLGMVWHMPNTRNLPAAVRVYGWEEVISHLRDLASRHNPP